MDYEEKELSKNSTVRNFRTVQPKGTRNVTREFEFIGIKELMKNQSDDRENINGLVVAERDRIIQFLHAISNLDPNTKVSELLEELENVQT